MQNEIHRVYGKKRGERNKKYSHCLHENSWPQGRRTDTGAVRGAQQDQGGGLGRQDEEVKIIIPAEADETAEELNKFTGSAEVKI